MASVTLPGFYSTPGKDYGFFVQLSDRRTAYWMDLKIGWTDSDRKKEFHDGAVTVDREQVNADVAPYVCGSVIFL